MASRNPRPSRVLFGRPSSCDRSRSRRRVLRLTAYLIAAFFVAASIGAASGLTSSRDVDALGDIYSGFNRSALLQTWTSGDPCGCEGSSNKGTPWRGITCDTSKDPQRVVEIDLSDSGITGYISGSIGALGKLTSFVVRNNGIKGGIPDVITALTALRTLDLSNNPLGSSIPPGVALLSALSSLDLSSCGLDGALPRVFKLSSLVALDVSNNSLSGYIDPAIGTLPRLSQVDMSYNNLTGALPDALGSDSALTSFAVAFNQLSGNLPPSLSSLRALSYLDIRGNNFTGFVPEAYYDVEQFLYDGTLLPAPDANSTAPPPPPIPPPPPPASPPPIPVLPGFGDAPASFPAPPGGSVLPPPARPSAPPSSPAPPAPGSLPAPSPSASPSLPAPPAAPSPPIIFANGTRIGGENGTAGKGGGAGAGAGEEEYIILDPSVPQEHTQALVPVPEGCEPCVGGSVAKRYKRACVCVFPLLLELHLDMEFPRFNDVNRESLVEQLALSVNVDQSQVAVYAIRPGSVIASCALLPPGRMEALPAAVAAHAVDVLRGRRKQKLELFGFGFVKVLTVRLPMVVLDKSGVPITASNSTSGSTNSSTNGSTNNGTDGSSGSITPPPAPASGNSSTPGSTTNSTDTPPPTTGNSSSSSSSRNNADTSSGSSSSSGGDDSSGSTSILGLSTAAVVSIVAGAALFLLLALLITLLFCFRKRYMSVSCNDDTIDYNNPAAVAAAAAAAGGKSGKKAKHKSWFHYSKGSPPAAAYSAPSFHADRAAAAAARYNEWAASADAAGAGEGSGWGFPSSFVSSGMGGGDVVEVGDISVVEITSDHSESLQYEGYDGREGVDVHGETARFEDVESGELMVYGERAMVVGGGGGAGMTCAALAAATAGARVGAAAGRERGVKGDREKDGEKEGERKESEWKPLSFFGWASGGGDKEKNGSGGESGRGIGRSSSGVSKTWSFVRPASSGTSAAAADAAAGRITPSASDAVAAAAAEVDGRIGGEEEEEEEEEVEGEGENVRDGESGSEGGREAGGEEEGGEKSGSGSGWGMGTVAWAGGGGGSGRRGGSGKESSGESGWKLPKLNMKFSSPKLQPRPSPQQQQQQSPSALRRSLVVPGARRFSLAELQMATDDFSPDSKIKDYPLGPIYCGDLSDGMEIAVRRIEPSVVEGQSDEDFVAVAANMARLRHAHVVQLQGYCVDYGERILVFQHFHLGSLYDHLHDGSRKMLMTWDTRVHIAIGCAQALEYLHEECVPAIVHRGISSRAILLDVELNPRIADAGLAVLNPLGSEAKSLSEQLAGGYAYNAPEYAMSGIYTAKSDVYSYGVVLLELLTGRKPVDPNKPKAESSLVRWVAPLLHDIAQLERMVDASLAGPVPDPLTLTRYAQVIARCIQPEPEFRPSMSKVVKDLCRRVRKTPAPTVPAITTSSSHITPDGSVGAASDA